MVVARLKRRQDFLKVAAARRKWVAPGFILQARVREHNEHLNGDISAVRVGFTVSRKVGNAVERNRVRRRLRAAVAEVMSKNARPDHDFVVIGRAAALTRPFSALVSDLRIALKRLDAFEESPVRAARASAPRPATPDVARTK
jgi:ribonuclease P protein component